MIILRPLLFIVIVLCMPSPLSCITGTRISEINQLIAELNRDKFTDAQTIRQRESKVKQGLTKRELTSAQIDQLNDAIERALERLSKKAVKLPVTDTQIPTQPIASIQTPQPELVPQKKSAVDPLTKALEELEDIQLEPTITKPPKKSNISEPLLIKPALIELEEPKKITLEYEQPKAGSQLADVIIGQVQTQLDEKKFKEKAELIRRLYAREIQNPSNTLDMNLMSQQLDNLLIQYKDNQKLITNKFILPLLSQASIERAAIDIRNTPGFTWHSNNPSTLINSKNILDDFLNGKLNLRRYKDLLEARVALATAANNPTITCDQIQGWRTTLGKYRDQMDEKRSSDICEEKK